MRPLRLPLPPACFAFAVLLGTVCLADVCLAAKVHRVTNEADWNRLPVLHGGDVVVVREGRMNNVNVDIQTESAAESAPIQVFAEKPGKTVFTGETRIVLDGHWITLAGFLFTEGGPGHKEGAVKFENGSSHCRLTHCSFRDFNQGKQDCSWVFLRGYRHRVDHCLFEGKRSENATLFIKPHDNPKVEAGPEVQRAHRIDHNYFGTRDLIKDNGYECIRIGDNKKQRYRMACTIEYNYFYQTIKSDSGSEMEVVSNKCCGNIYRNNVFEDCDGQLTLRHGQDCLVEGNWFIGTGGKRESGVRVVGINHVIRGNTFVRLGGDDLRSALCLMDGKYGDSTSDRYEGVENVHVENNLFYDCRQPINMGECKGPADPPRSIVFRNNRIHSSAGGNVFQIEEDVTFKESRGNAAFQAQKKYGRIPPGTTMGPFQLEVDLKDKPVNLDEVKPVFEGGSAESYPKSQAVESAS